MTKVAPVLPGTVLMGKYRVERQLGSGGMGVVVEATHVALNQRVAIKLLNADLVDSPEILGRFLREARIAASLPSHHIARATDVGQTEAGVPYLVMELLAGNDLAVELERCGRLEIARAVSLVLEACEGVADAHAVGLVHRDLKPANLFLARSGSRPPVVKVLDFGLSKEPKQDEGVSLTQAGSIFGTPQYMSPEQVLSTKDVDARSDQHALAIVLFELLTGRTPYEGTTVNQLIVAIATATPLRVRAFRPEVPAGLDAAVARALAKKPEERFPSLAGFARALAPFGGPTAQESAGHVERILAAHGVEPVESGRSSGSPSEVQVTSPLGLDAKLSPALSQTDLTSSIDPTKRGRRLQRAMLTGGGAALVVGAALALLISRGRGVESAPAAIPAASAPPAASVAGIVIPATAEPSAATPAPTASAAVGKRPKLTSVKPVTPAPAVSKAIGIFGERTK